MTKHSLLKDIKFGNSVAEQEVDILKECFVFTRSWDRLLSGEVDVIYGAKGSGKSALYTLLNQNEDALFARNIVLLSAENPRGSTIFSDLQTAPPAGETEFVNLWKLYILSMIGSHLSQYYADSPESKAVISSLAESGLIEPGSFSLKSIFSKARRYIAKYFNPESMEPNVSVGQGGTIDGMGFKVTFKDPGDELTKLGVRTIEDLLETADKALAKSKYTLWLLFDRLDVAFAESAELEKNAIRALFKVYLDLQNLKGVQMKLFVRTDIWSRITKDGFREATHIKRELKISWDRDLFLNLIIRRFTYNKSFCEFYGISRDHILQDKGRQQELFYRIFPEKIDSGKNPDTLEWMIGRTADGKSQSAPRDLINLINASIDIQSQRLDIDSGFNSGELLFERPVVKDGLTKASLEKVEKHLFAEYAQHRDTFEKLRAGKAEYSVEALSRRLGLTAETALEIGNELAELGFFSKESSGDVKNFWIPFIYRDGLEIKQGVAE